jgi:hypothetical protein
MWGGKAPDYPSALTDYNTFQQSSFLPPWQASIPSPFNSPAQIDAIKQQAALYGYDPAAYAAMVQMETANSQLWGAGAPTSLSLWDPAATTGKQTTGEYAGGPAYAGLTQMGPGSFADIPNNMFGGLTWPSYQIASGPEQTSAYGDWLNFYSKGGADTAASLVTGGIGSLDPAMQAAIMTGTQFGPYAGLPGTIQWPQALAAGNMNMPVTAYPQAPELGNKGYPTIGSMYDAYTNMMAGWPQDQLYTNYYGPYGGTQPAYNYGSLYDPTSGGGKIWDPTGGALPPGWPY